MAFTQVRDKDVFSRWIHELVMRRATKDFDGMGQKICDSIERLHSAARTAGQVHDQGALTNSGFRTRKHGARIFFAPFFSHKFAKPRQKLFADCGGCFRSAITRPDSRAASSENQIDRSRLRQRREPLLQFISIVRNCFAGNDLPAERAAAFRHCRTRTVLTLATSLGH